MDTQLEIPDAWNALDVSGWRGSILILGASNTGKSTFARYLYTRLLSVHQQVGYLDADVGQSSLGAPATITMAIRGSEDERAFPPAGPRRVCFVGNNTPLRHIPIVLLSLYRMQLFAVHRQVDTLVVDTSGLIDPLHGGADLKWGKVELFRPCQVVAFQREEELEPILVPLRHMSGVCLYELPVAEAVRRRAYAERRAYRAARYRDYFVDAQRIPLPYTKLAVFPKPTFLPGRLVGLEGRDGFTLALGIVERADERVLWLRTPWSGQGQVAAVRLGDLLLDERTFQEMRIRNWEL
jgi:polynucleotide 5'-hydroxyl-kinase GRC3/NOL9